MGNKYLVKAMNVILFIFMSLIGVKDVFATITYSGNEFDTFKERTKDEIGEKYSDVYYGDYSYVDGESETYYSTIPSLKSPYDVGALSDDTVELIGKTINYYRYLAGVQELTSVTTSEDLQAGALVRAFEFNHQISSSSKPSDMSDELWNQGANVGHNVIAMGYSPQGSILGWINEGYSTYLKSFDTVGHRFAILNGTNSGFEFGFVDGITSSNSNKKIAIGGMNEFRNTMVNPFSAYPVPGYMPIQDISASRASWTLQLKYNLITFTSSEDIIIKVTRLSDNTSYEATIANGLLEYNSGYNMISFAQPKGILENTADSSDRYIDGDQYKVEVTGLKDKTTNEDVEINYTVNFFDVINYVPADYKSYSLVDGFSSITVPTDFNTTEFLEEFKQLLPTQVKVYNEVGKSEIVGLVGEWVLDEENNCWTNTIDKSQLSSNIKVNDDTDLTVKVKYTISDSTGVISVSPSKVTLGSEAIFTICSPYGYYLGNKDILLYKRDDSGKYEAVVSGDEANVADSNTVYDVVSDYKVTYTMDNVLEDNKGTYFAIVKGSINYLIYGAELDIKDKEVSEIEIDTPIKNTYKVGDSIDITGGKIKATYDNGTTSIIDITNDMISGFTSDEGGVGSVVITYNNKTTNFNVLIVDNINEVISTTYGKTLADVVLPSNDYGTYTFELDDDTSVGDVGTNEFVVNFKPSNTDYSEVTNLKVKLKVEKANPVFDKPTGLEATYGDTLKDIDLPISSTGKFEWINDNTNVGVVGNHEFEVTYIPNDTTNYNEVTFKVSVKVNKATPSYTLPTDLKAGYGDTLKDVELPSGWSWNDDTLSVGNIGTKTFEATYTPTDTNNYNVVENISLEVVVDKTTPSYEVPTNLKAVYGNTLKDIELPSSSTGRFVWKNEDTSVGEVGSHEFEVTYVPNDTTNYRIVDLSVSVEVEKAMPSYEIPSNIVVDYGSKLSDITLPGGFSFEDSSLSVGDVGIHKYYVVYTPTDSKNFTTVSNIEVEVEVVKIDPVYDIPDNLEVGYGKTLNDIILPEGFSFEDSSLSVGDVGTHKFILVYTPTDTKNYNVVKNEVEVKVIKAVPEYGEITELEATYGDVLNDVKLPDSLNGKFEWSDSLTDSVGNVGKNTFLVKYIPNDTKNYEVINNISVIVNVKKKQADIVETLVLDGIVYNPLTKLSDISLPTGWSWVDGNIVPTVDKNEYMAIYTPTDMNNYDYSNQDLNRAIVLDVEKAMPTYTSPILSATFDEMLENIILPSLSNGKFEWQTDSKTILTTTGKVVYKVKFIPNDEVNYSTVTDIDAIIWVGKKVPEYTLPENLETTIGNTLGDIELPEGFTWDDEDVILDEAGTKKYLVTYTPSNTDDYVVVNNIEVNVKVNKKKADKIQLPVLEEITYDGKTLGNIKLPEGWSWVDESIVPTAGINGYEVMYTPADTDKYDYSDQDLTPLISLNVLKATPDVSYVDIINVMWNQKASDVLLPEGYSFMEDVTFNEIGEFKYYLTYTPSDTVNYNNVGNIEAIVVVNKAIPDVTIPDDIVITTETVLGDIKLPEGWSWVEDVLVTESGEYAVVYTPEDEEHYQSVTKKINITYEKKNVDSKENETSEETENSKTGDSILLWIVLELCSLICLFIIPIVLKDKDKE